MKTTTLFLNVVVTGSTGCYITNHLLLEPREQIVVVVINHGAER